MSHRRNVLFGIAVDQFNQNTGMRLVVRIEQVVKEARGERGKYPDPDPPFLHSSDGRNVKSAIAYALQRNLRSMQEALTR
ncbi:hypothetical protein AA0535_1583 [Asaia krungthepensis NRIC 0535]|uniref:Uncharacterized protein n=1 Tax=Asaia krungthepensis NRIC 0535 TaxID=1307925 RepID=A0ABQ0Q2S3_9PROT|nr:hypothetical protein AA0535_1583 [Asaia krungthepensis NRIC 0535]